MGVPALPDVVPQDSVTDACKRIGCQFVESLFYRAALQNGYGTNSEQRARELFLVWGRDGYKALPEWVRDFILRVNGGEFH